MKRRESMERGKDKGKGNQVILVIRQKGKR